MTRYSSLVGNALALYAVQGLNYLVPLLLLPLLLRRLGPDGFGSMAFAQSLMGYALIATEFGYNFTAARDISVARSDPVAVARIYWTTLAAKLLLLVVSLLVVALVVIATPAFREQWPVYAASSAIVLGNFAFPQWYLQGLERLRSVAAAQAVAKVALALVTLWLVQGPADLWLAALLGGAPQLAGALAAGAMGSRLWPREWYRPRWCDIHESLRHSWHLFAGSLSTTLYQNTNTFVLGLLCGPRAVALYSIGQRLVSTLQTLVNPVFQAVFPRASLLFAKDPPEALRLVRQVARLTLPAMALAGVVIALCAPAIVRLLGGEHYAAAVGVVRIMAPVPLLVTLAMLVGQVVMINLGLSGALFRIYLGVGIANLAAMPLLIWRWQAEGAAWSLLAAELLGPLLMLRALRRSGRISSDVRAPGARFADPAASDTPQAS
jgi:O-antigen/teichoic acid export membrane protein